MKRMILGLVLLLPHSVQAGIGVDLVADQIDDRLRIILVNAGTQDVLVNRRLALGVPGSPAEVTLVVKDASGKVRALSTKVRVDLPSEKDFVVLNPGMLVGREYPIARLISYFELGPGRYDVRAIYNNPHRVEQGALGGPIASKTLPLEVR